MRLSQSPPLEPLIERLSRFVRLRAADVAALTALMKSRQRFLSRTDIISEGDVARWGFVLLDGMAARYRILSDGRRQIVSFIVPGDLCDLHAALLKRIDHSIGTIVASSIAIIRREQLDAILSEHPRVTETLRWSALQEAAMQREHIVALGRRNAHERVAYLLCDLSWRGGNWERGPEPGPLPLTQSDMADALGLTPIHVNRVLQDFRKDRLIVLDRHRLRILDMERLMGVADLTKEYLHLDGAPAAIERACILRERRRGSAFRSAE